MATTRGTGHSEVAYAAGSGTGASVHAMATVALVDLAPAHGIPDPPDVVLTCPDGTIEDDIPATMLSGPPLELLEHYAAEVDVLIVGSHERSAVDPLLPWSTSGHLARRCRHPLIAVPNGTINVATPQGSGQ
jgi:nucleotide-binding universal stress UspA family protein